MQHFPAVFKSRFFATENVAISARQFLFSLNNPILLKNMQCLESRPIQPSILNANGVKW